MHLAVNHLRGTPHPRSVAMKAVAGTLCLLAAAASAQPIVIHAGALIDGRGGVRRDVSITVDSGRIRSIGGAGGAAATYDFSRLTVLPGLIDTHVHIDSHFGKDGRASNTGETPQQRILAAAQNAYITLMAGFTTVQSIGAASDVDLRAALERGLPGPRLLTSAGQLTDTSLSPDSIRKWISGVVTRGADVVKIFASKSIREGGGQTMSDDKLA